MFNNLKEECKTRILQYFPERQVYLRTQSEVKYYHLSTKLQATLATILTITAFWCLLTIGNVIWGFSPYSSTVSDSRNFERSLAEERAKLQNTQLMMAQQKESFEKIARSFEEKHAAISQIVGTPVTANTDQNDADEAISYAKNRIIMSPQIRDPFPRTSRRNFSNTSSEGNSQVDRFLVNLGDSQDNVLKTAELDMLDDIERKRAIIKATNVDLKDVLDASPYGKGGPTHNSDTEANFTSGEFPDRMDTVKARITESELLNAALTAMPLGHPINAENYTTSRYGMRSDPFTKRPTFHSGLDFGSYKDASIVAASEGIVTMAGRNGGMGKMVEIDHGHGFKTRYGHLNSLNVKRGQRVTEGQLIGGMGSTGRSTSTHLHYEVYFQGRTIDPTRFLKAGQYVQ